ncbi:uncharacterized protein LOC115442363 [Manduca sexta]|uniref:Uncharacterized protein n=1 Tax=Manduca sexta TaxID=7130 RepID=A0A921Z0V5_MANSE|nr:uncharacterized protein LOC115442363 [Manduca sexta]KAG6448314.1 hypothetical protein O3G_MSEX005439 [Manduca sexta]
MVNYRRVVCETAALAALVVATLAAPAPPPGCDHVAHYDQRQNGSDNIRVHVDGVVVAVMPAESFAESLLTALPDFADFLEEEEFDTHKPKPPQSEVPMPPSNAAPSKPEEKPQATPDKEEVASLPAKPAEASNPDASSVDSSTAQPAKNQKKEQYLKQRKAQRVKNYLASFLMPLLRKNRHH